MDNTTFNFVVQIIIPLLCTIITYFLVPYIKKSVDAKTLKQWQDWSTMAVQCAEIIFKGTGKGKDKKEFVVNFLDDFINKEKTLITKEQLDILIESAVEELNTNKK